MAKIKPFKAVIYNKEKVGDVAKVVCPPYDVIPKERVQYYYDKNPYNLINLILSREAPGKDKYENAGIILKDWIKSGVFARDEKPAVYFYSQQYMVRGEKKVRLGFISLMHLGAAHAHENTRLEAKEDRFSLLKKVKANLSPIFVIFEDRKRMVQRVYQEQVRQMAPFIDITDEEKTNHKLWRLDSPEILLSIQAAMDNEDAFIADGHHRYEVACAYRDLMQKKMEAVTGEEDFNYLLTYFTNTDPRGLTILPIHRLVKIGARFDTAKVLACLSANFAVEEVKERGRFFFLMEKGGRTEHLLGMYKDNKFWILRLKNVKAIDQFIADKPKVSRSLDVSILNSMVLKEILGSEPDTNNKNIEYSHDADELIAIVDNDHSAVAFFLNSSNIKDILSVASAGEKMPPKSTFFYPKVLSGLVINKLEDK